MLETLKKATHTQVERIHNQWVAIQDVQRSLGFYDKLEEGQLVPLACLLSGNNLNLPQDAIYELVVQHRNNLITEFMKMYLKFQRAAMALDTEMPVQHTEETLYTAIANELGITLPPMAIGDLDG